MDHLKARFYNHAALNVAESKESGTKIYDDLVMVELSVKGSKGESISYVATDEHKKNFPQAWAEYKGESFTGNSGTPLAVLGEHFTLARQMEMKGLGIYSVEDLAGINDVDAIKIREGLKAKHLANKYLEGQALAKQDVTIEQVADLQRRLAELEMQNELLAANQKQKPGRKPAVNDEVAQAIM